MLVNAARLIGLDGAQVGEAGGAIAPMSTAKQHRLLIPVLVQSLALAQHLVGTTLVARQRGALCLGQIAVARCTYLSTWQAESTGDLLVSLAKVLLPVQPTVLV